MIKAFVLTTLFVLLNGFLSPAVAEGIGEQLASEIEILAAAMERADTRIIASPAELERDRGFLQALFGSDEEKAALWEAGRTFVRFLDETREEVADLSLDEWLAVADVLLEADALVSTGTGWGNLVIKLGVCDQLLHRMLDLVDTARTEGNVALVERLVPLQRRIAACLPSSEAMAKMALRRHGFRGFGQVETLALRQPAALEEDALEQALRGHFGGKQATLKAVTEMMAAEQGTRIETLQGLYEEEIPWRISMIGHIYLDFAWAVYLQSRILLLGSQSQSLSREVLDPILQDSYGGSERQWMTLGAYKAASKGGIYAERYLESLREDRTWKWMKRRAAGRADAGASSSPGIFLPSILQ